MTMKLKDRIEFRVDSQTKRMLDDLAHSRGISVGELMRSLVQDRLTELGWKPASKREAADRLLGFTVGPLPDPDRLNREIRDAIPGDAP